MDSGELSWQRKQEFPSRRQTSKPAVSLSKEEILALQPPPDHAGSGHGRAAQAQAGQGSVHRHRRTRRAAGALSGGGGRGAHRAGGFRFGRLYEPAAAGSFRHHRCGPPENRSRRRPSAQSESGNSDRYVRDAPDQRERARPVQGLRHHRRRHGQFPDALSGERCLRAARQAECVWLDFPLRRPDHDFRRTRAGLATAASIPSRLRRDWFLRAPKAACWACCRESWARSRRRKR